MPSRSEYREGSHIAGEQAQTYVFERKKECKSFLAIDSFSSGKSICKACRVARYKEKCQSKGAGGF